MTETRIVLNPEEVWKRRVLSRKSQAQIAKHAGVDRSHISLIERGERRASREVAEGIAAALGCTVDDLKTAA